MNNTNKITNPFYVYTDKGSLYIKNINSSTEKLYNNVVNYSANIDINNNIHICCIDNFGKLIHITNNNNHWKKKIVCKVFNNIRNIKNMRLYIVNSFLNIFIAEESPVSEGLYRITHFNFSNKNYKLSKFQVNNVLKSNSSIYKLTTDSLSNFILQYKLSNNLSRSQEEKTLIFNNTSRTWLIPGINPIPCTNLNDTIITDIKDDLFEYYSSITYKI